MTDMIGITKAMLWEEAKGKLRALVSVNGQCASTDEWRSEQWQQAQKAVEQFISDFEDESLHE